MSILLSPLVIKNIQLKNRIVISPMCQYSSVVGFANNWHLVHLGSRAVGGAALIMQEATAVSPEGRITASDAGLYNDAHIGKWKEITAFIQKQGALAGIQLAHAGRKGSTTAPWQGGKRIEQSNGGWQTVAPSAIAYYLQDEPPLALDADGIKKVVSDFKASAGRALQAGYDVIEIHAAHGYLLHQFLSPLINQRTDSYGGTFENRTRLLLEVITAVRTVWTTERPLFVRISATDYVQGGWNLDDSVKLATLLKTYDVDLIDCSSGGAVTNVKIEVKPGYQVPFAQRIKTESGMLTAAVGLLTHAAQMEEILTAQQADLIFIARASLRHPYLALQLAHDLGEPVAWPLPYERAKI